MPRPILIPKATRVRTVADTRYIGTSQPGARKKVLPTRKLFSLSQATRDSSSGSRESGGPSVGLMDDLQAGVPGHWKYDRSLFGASSFQCAVCMPAANSRSVVCGVAIE